MTLIKNLACFLYEMGGPWRLVKEGVRKHRFGISLNIFPNFMGFISHL